MEKLKRILCASILMSLFFIVSSFSQSMGDVNSDNSIDIVDALLVAQYYVGFDPIALTNLDAADVNCEDGVDIVDALLIAQYYVGIITEFPCTLTPTPTPGSESITYELQAEDEERSSGGVETDHSGYTGSGYVNTDNASGEWIEWSFDLSADSTAVCEFRYACESDARSMDLSINGGAGINLGFPASGAWTTWATQTTDTVMLSAGLVTIRLTAATSGGAPNMDKMDITITGGVIVAPTETPGPTPTPTVDPNATPTPTPAPDEGVITGELKMWHKVTITWDGPDTSETADPNPFTDYRLLVTFTGPSGQVYVVPGYYAADGDAAHTSANSGNKWRCHISPDEQGIWSYSVSFRSGTHIAQDDNPSAGSSAGFMDSHGGSFTVGPTDKTGRDMRSKGHLKYVGGHFLQFAGNNEYFIKQGPDAPENLFAYEDFDGDFKSDGEKDGNIKTYSAHVGDWNTGDPTWANGKGKGLIGAINYLASEGLNAFSFIPMNIDGDDRNVFPYLDYDERYRMDVSRLDQWEIVFEHATKMGFFIHFKTQETENERLLDSGDLGTQRRLYYRELIARFAHHPALNWNLGEEINDCSTAQKSSWASYFWNNDPYQHHIVIHNGDNHYDLMGPDHDLTGMSLQTSNSDFRSVHSRVLEYLERSRDAGKPWAVACDEPGDASHALRPAGDEGDSWTDGRKNALWGTFMAGGWGNEWYFGYDHAHSDLTLQDFRSRDGFFDYCRFALEFFNNNNIPFWEMTNDNDISSDSDDYGFYKHNEIYLVYLKNGGSTDLDLSNANGTFQVKWYDPRNGGILQNGSVTTVTGGGNPNLGNAPNNSSSDWVIMVRK